MGWEDLQSRRDRATAASGAGWAKRRFAAACGSCC